ncbi:hypothetical protein HQ585_12535 [candidate division KSB1 bacterium]|nr:hypothetical protein [candidate division KSB1 bacterium]
MNPIKEYFKYIADKLEALSRISGTLTHKPDIGNNREVYLMDFLNDHLPDSLHAVQGGTIIDPDNVTSKQIDIIIKSDMFPKFSSNNKTYIIADSIAAAISVKSKLNKRMLTDALINLDSIPSYNSKALSLNNSSIIRPELWSQFTHYFPIKIVFAYDGISIDKIKEYANDILAKQIKHVDNPISYIIVNKKYILQYCKAESTSIKGDHIPANTLWASTISPDQAGYPLAMMIAEITKYIAWLHYMKFIYAPYLNNAFFA